MLSKKEQPKKIYLSIKKGVVEQMMPNGARVPYSSVDGTLESIHSRERTFGTGGEPVKYWYIDLRDGKDLYSIGLPLYSGVLRSIILSIASAPYLSKETNIRIEPYLRNGYTKVMVYADEEKLDWIVKELPAVKTTNVGTKVVKDESERDAYIESLIADIQKRLESPEDGGEEED